MLGHGFLPGSALELARYATWRAEAMRRSRTSMMFATLRTPGSYAGQRRWAKSTLIGPTDVRQAIPQPAVTCEIFQAAYNRHVKWI